MEKINYFEYINSSMKSGQLPFKAHFLTDDVLHFLKNISLYFKKFGCIIFRSVKPWSAISLNDSVLVAFPKLN